MENHNTANENNWLDKIVNVTKNFCTLLGFLILIVLVGMIVQFVHTHKLTRIENNSYLVIDFSNNYQEGGNSDILSEIMNEPNFDFQTLLQTINYAASDDHITGLVALIDKSNLDFAQLQEIAQNVQNFKEQGKKLYAFSRGFGELGGGNKEYYLASFFDEIYMQPHTEIGLNGVSIEVPFFRDVLDKFGIYPEFYARHEYKNAMASLTDKKMSLQYKQELQELVNSLTAQLVRQISINRKLTDEEVIRIINQAPLSAEQGMELKLIDDVMYLSELENKLKEQGVSYFVSINDYADTLTPNKGDLPVVAVLNLNGIIHSGESSGNLDGEMSIGSKSAIRDINAISDTPNLKGVVVRINSPGGSYNAADEIYFALRQLKKDKNIPIVVSQSSYAASGGYFISLAGDYVFTNPATITGSIGVIGGKIVLQKLWNKLGIHWDSVKFGENSDILSSNHQFSPTEKAIFNTLLDEVYDDFVAKVQENRQLTKPIDEIARGRVWSGAEAKQMGLVDEIGGFNRALSKVVELAGLQPQQNIVLHSYPQIESWGERLEKLLLPGGNVQLNKIFSGYGVNIEQLRLFKRLQYDTVLLPFEINM